MLYKWCMTRTVLWQQRRLLDKTQDEIAAEVGIDRADLSRYERGFKKPNQATLGKLAAAVSCSEPERLLEQVP